MFNTFFFLKNLLLQPCIGRFKNIDFKVSISAGSTALKSDFLSPSARRPWVNRSILPVVRLHRHQSALSAPVLVCIALVKVPFSPMPIPKDYIFSSLTCYQVSGEEDSSNSKEEIERAIVYRAYWSSIIFTDDDHLLDPRFIIIPYL